MIQLIFNDPLEVSYHQDELQMKDFLIIEVIDVTLFKGKDSSKGIQFLEKKNAAVKSGITKQLKNDTATAILVANADKMKNGMNSVMIGQAVMNVAMSASLSYVMGTFHVLQIIVF